MLERFPSIFQRHLDISRRAKAFRVLAWCLTIPIGLPTLVACTVLLFVFVPLFATTGGAVWATLQTIFYVFVAAVLPWALFLWPLNHQFRAELDGTELHPAWAISTAVLAFLLALVAPILLFVIVFSSVDNGFLFSGALAGSVISPILILQGVRILKSS